jgi:hypothetical protein
MIDRYDATGEPMTAKDILARAFDEKRPCVLWLGQDAWAQPSRPDRVLALFLEQRLGRLSSPDASWRDVLAKEITAADYEWLTERFERNVVAEGITEALDLPWSAVFTSSIDPVLIRRLETNGRQPEALVATDHVPASPRSTTRPPVYFLFGRSSEHAEPTRCPPKKAAELTRRANVAIVLLDRLAETVSAMGVLVIDGFAPGRDWLQLDAMFSAIPAGTSLRVLWCGARTSPDDQLVCELVEDGTLVLEPRRLSELVAEMTASGMLGERARFTRHETGIISLANEDFIDVAPGLRLRVEASAAIVDDEWTQSQRLLSTAAEEDAFHRFHGELGGTRLLVEGIARGFAIVRPFEPQLHKRVGELIERRGDVERFVLLHGQSGTGKSVALARAALMFRTERPVPVLFASGRIPLRHDVEEFCAVAERQGAQATLVLCDANASPHLYAQLSEALQSRGRRAVIVGTSYRIEDTKLRSVDVILAPDEVTPGERKQLVELVGRYARLSQEELDLLASQNSDHVFAYLYRILASSRGRLISGVAGEARAAEESLRQRGQRHITGKRFASQLAQQLMAAGLQGSSMPLFERSAGSAFGNDAAGRLIDYVMAAGRLDVYVPLNLLMRVLRTHVTELRFDQIAGLFRDIDLFRWRQDEYGIDLLVGPRLSLEADLICRRRLADPGRELGCLVELLLGVRPQGLDRSTEMTFLLDLLRKVDERGPRGAVYASGYLSIAEALTRLRAEHGLDHASVMLQESNFRRAWLRTTKRETGVSIEERERVLDDARKVVDEALRRAQAEPRWASPRARQDLFVERAAIYGFAAVGHAVRGESPERVWSDYEAAREASRQAMGVAPNYYPYDVALWLPLDILDNANELTEIQRAEIVADIYTVLDRIDAEGLPPDQFSQFHRKQDRIGRALQNWKLVAATQAALEKHNPALAVFLEARAFSKNALDTKARPVGVELRREAEKAIELLEHNWDKIGQDARCLRLLLELQWFVATDERLLRRERRPLPHDANVRTNLLRVLTQISSGRGDVLDNPLRYLEAVLTWTRREYPRAREQFSSLGRDTEYEDRHRPRRRLFIADADGAPVKHRGHLSRERNPGHWLIEVEGSGEIGLLARDFPGHTLQTGREVHYFAIAFNYLGPIADPLNRYEVPA